MLIGAGVTLGTFAYFRMMANADPEKTITKVVSMAFDPTQSFLGGIVFRGKPYGGIKK